MYRATQEAVILLFLLSVCLMCGCGDPTTVTYLPMGLVESRPCVDSNVAFYQRGQCQKAELKQEWLESYLLGIRDSRSRQVFDCNTLRVAIPSIQQGLADWGNACVGNVFTEGQNIRDATIFVHNGSITIKTQGQTWKFGHRDFFIEKLSEAPIPENAYVRQSPAKSTLEKSPSTTSPSTLKCPSCGQPYVAGSKFCSKCGKALSIECPNCKSPVSAGTNFCPNCGKRLQPE